MLEISKKLFYSVLRNALLPGTNDPAYDEWLLRTVGSCHYKDIDKHPCAGEIVLDHVLGGYQGIKASGVLKVPACWFHNQLAVELDIEPLRYDSGIKDIMHAARIRWYVLK